MSHDCTYIHIYILSMYVCTYIRLNPKELPFEINSIIICTLKLCLGKKTVHTHVFQSKFLLELSFEINSIIEIAVKIMLRDHP